MQTEVTEPPQPPLWAEPGEVGPQYLRGELGMVVARGDYTVTVRLLRPVGRFRSGEIRCPPLLLEKLDSDRWRPAS